MLVGSGQVRSRRSTDQASLLFPSLEGLSPPRGRVCAGARLLRLLNRFHFFKFEPQRILQSAALVQGSVNNHYRKVFPLGPSSR